MGVTALEINEVENRTGVRVGARGVISGECDFPARGFTGERRVVGGLEGAKELAKTAHIVNNSRIMNAMEVIDQFKRLPEEEQGKVVAFIRQDCSTKVRYADDNAAMTAARAVFDEHPELFRKLAQ